MSNNLYPLDIIEKVEAVAAASNPINLVSIDDVCRLLMEERVNCFRVPDGWALHKVEVSYHSRVDATVIFHCDKNGRWLTARGFSKTVEGAWREAVQSAKETDLFHSVARPAL